MDRPEISDLIVKFDAQGQRAALSRSKVVSALLSGGQRWAARIAAALPVDACGDFDPAAVDRVLIDAHRELQRLSEEFQQGPRLARILRPAVAALRASGVAPIRIVDVGCGIGFVTRWLDARGDFGSDVEWIGCDMNPALIAEAQRAARLDGLATRFEVADAFSLDLPGHLFTSTGVLHHFRGADLTAFFAAHRRSPEFAGFIHSDIEASRLAPLGSALFHLARMRIPLAQHDGIHSAVRAHPSEHLVCAAREALPELAIGFFDRNRLPVPITKVLRSLVAFRREWIPALQTELGPWAKRLEFVS